MALGSAFFTSPHANRDSDEHVPLPVPQGGTGKKLFFRMSCILCGFQWPYGRSHYIRAALHRLYHHFMSIPVDTYTFHPYTYTVTVRVEWKCPEQEDSVDEKAEGHSAEFVVTKDVERVPAAVAEALKEVVDECLDVLTHEGSSSDDSRGSVDSLEELKNL